MAEANSINFMAMLNPQFAAQQQKFALQQAMAAEMMKEGGEQPSNNQLANPGGIVIQNSPLSAASRGIEKALGAYMMNKNIDNQMNAYAGMSGKQTPDQSPDGQGGSPLLPWQTNAMTGQPQGQQMGNMLAGGGNMPSMQDIVKEQVAPVWAKGQLDQQRELALKGMQMVNGQVVPIPGYNPAVAGTAGAVKGAETAVTPQNFNGHIGFITPPGQGALSPTQNQQPAMTSSSGGPMTSSQGSPVPISSTGGNNIDFNNPIAVKKAESEATKQGENTADAAKSFAAINSTIDTQLKNLETLKQLSLRMPDRGPHETEVWLSKHLGKQDMSSADAQFNTMNKQMFVNGLMGSIPPGSRLDIPIVKALQAAKEVDPTLDNKSRLAVINSHIQTLKDAQQNAYANYGFQGGTPHAPVAASAASTVGVTHVWTPNGIQPIGAQ